MLVNTREAQRKIQKNEFVKPGPWKSMQMKGMPPGDVSYANSASTTAKEEMAFYLEKYAKCQTSKSVFRKSSPPETKSHAFKQASKNTTPTCADPAHPAQNTTSEPTSAAAQHEGKAQCMQGRYPQHRDTQYNQRTPARDAGITESLLLHGGEVVQPRELGLSTVLLVVVTANWVRRALRVPGLTPMGRCGETQPMSAGAS